MKLFNSLTRQSVSATLTGLFFTMLLTCAAQAQTTAFTYQGRLTDGAAAASGTYDLGFALYDAETGGTLIGTAITRSNVTVSSGIFTVQLDFGATAFAANTNRFLQIAVKKTTETNFITLTPRQPLTSSPYSIRTISANVSDALSTACVGCVDNAKITTVSGSKVTGTVASATTAGNVTGVVAIANGGTGSATQNFVDTTSVQTVGGSKTFSNTVTANTFSANSGGVAMNDNFLRLRGSGDNNHGMRYSSVVDGAEFRGNIGFRWVNGTNGAIERMRLDGSGNLTVNGNITTTGTISGTINLANNSVGSAQVTDGSLRVSDLAINSQLLSLSSFTLGAHGCAGLALTGGGAVGDLLTVYLANNTPAGFYVQPTVFTTAGSATIYICNTLNGNNTLPTQSVRVVITRP